MSRARFQPTRLSLCLLIGAALIGSAFLGWRKNQPDDDMQLVVYSGRGEDLIAPLLTRFEQDTGIRVQVRYGQTAEMAATILEEGRNSPADVIFAQDAGALGALARAGRLRVLPGDLLDRVEPRFRSPRGDWIGLSGRARVVVYNPERVRVEDLPADIHGFCDPVWRGRIGWAPANGSYQAFVTALRVTEGEEETRAWLACMQANRPRVYAKNTPILTAVAAGEIDVGLANHYYLHQMIRQQGADFSVRNHYLRSGTLVNVAGVGIIDRSRRRAVAERFIRYLLDTDAQAYFTEETFEYPLARGAEPAPDLTPLRDIETPDLDLGQLEDLNGTLRLLQELGIL